MSKQPAEGPLSAEDANVPKAKIESAKKEKSSPDYSSWGRRMLEDAGWVVSDTSEAKRDCGLCKPLASRPGVLGQLSIVATPIGNLGDMTLRALATLAEADFVACEDTRVTGGLLHRFGIKKTLIAYHDYNESGKKEALIKLLETGNHVALVSDAGTPLISDPGYKIVRACREKNIPVVAVPGASALLTGLAAAGLPTDRFLFVGFLSSKQTARRKELENLRALDATLVFYESPQRMDATLADMALTLGAGRDAVVGRELTKLYEDMRGGTLESLAALFAGQKPKGEVVIMVGPPNEAAGDALDLDAEIRAALETLSLRDAAAFVAEKTGLRRKEVYARALALVAEEEA